MNVFLSHNSADKTFARIIGGQLKLAGVEVWFDDWNIKAGESIPGRLDEGLTSFNVFLLLWSVHASKANWVRQELETAIMRRANDPAIRIVPVRLDDTPLPELLRAYRCVDGAQALSSVTREVLGLATDRELRKALQSGLDNLALPYKEFWGVGVLFGCPKCGAEPEALKGWEGEDEFRGDRYAGAQCTECGWSDGGEI
jgi:hypothetical protein